MHEFTRDIPTGRKPLGIVNAVIEVIGWSRDKYEYYLDWEAFVSDRVLHSSVVFPVEYGFIPKTWFHDNDPLDIMVKSYEPLEVGCIVEVKPIGILVMEVEEGGNPKILSVPTRDPRFKGYNDTSDFHPHILKEIQEFFEVYKRLEPRKWVKFKEWKNREEAKKLIEYAMELYRKRK